MKMRENKRSRFYDGVRFELWPRADAWFWLVTDLPKVRVAGAAASEAEAVSQARGSIDELKQRFITNVTATEHTVT